MKMYVLTVKFNSYVFLTFEQMNKYIAEHNIKNYEYQLKGVK